jgi:hydrogenase maturation protease
VTFAPVRVLGLGNVLMGDDALGPWVIEELLAQWEFPEGVSVIDVGTPGLDLTPYLAEADTVILVDTVKSDGPPGTLRVYTRDQLLRHPPPARLSPHDPGLTEALLSLDFAGVAPKDVVLIGVVPGKVEKGVGLTPRVRESVAAAADEVIASLRALHLAPRRRYGPPSAPWWERPAGEPLAAIP